MTGSSFTTASGPRIRASRVSTFTRKSRLLVTGRITLLLPVLVLLIVHAAAPKTAHAQAGLRAALEKLDKNDNEYIEPSEVTPLARPYLEQMQNGRSRYYRPFYTQSIQRILEAARAYHAERNGVSGRSVRPEGKPMVKSFDFDPEKPLIPGFGIGKLKYPYTQQDVDEADSTLRRSDRNRDNFIDRAEAERARWTHRNPFDDDLNKDERLSKMELIQRYARRRLLRDDIDELVRKAQRVGSEAQSKRRSRTSEDSSQWWRKGGSGYWLTASILGRFDANRNGRLEPSESVDLGIQPGRIDIDGDGDLTREELFAVISGLQKEVGDVTDGLPGWFFERDKDKDGQVAMHEFTDEWTRRKHQEFELMDANGDGLLTTVEASRAKSAVGGTYENKNAEVLPPRRTIISEIEVDDDYLLSDLNVQISITHSNDSFLDAYLTGPDGHRVELFTEVGGSGDHFAQTLFDDESTSPIVKGKPPYKGTYYTEARTKKQPGLSHFYGKTVKGVWQLVIRGTRSERFGMLNSWNLQVKPQEEVPGSQQDKPMNKDEPLEKAEIKTDDATDAAAQSTSTDKGRKPRKEREEKPAKKSDQKKPKPTREEKEARKKSKKAEAAGKAAMDPFKLFRIPNSGAKVPKKSGK